MISARLDNNGPFAVRWPQTDDEIIALAEAWVRYEDSRPAANQLKDIPLAMIQAQLDIAKAARENAQSGEAARTITTGEYRGMIATIRAHLERALTFLKYKHADNLLLLENAGWNVRQGGRGRLTVRMPTTDADLLILLERYVAFQSTLAPAQQVPDPPLATMQALAVDVQDLAQNRRGSKVKRSSNIQVRNVATRRLLNMLQINGMALALLEFEEKVDRALENWGYTVVAASSQNGEPPVEEPPAEG